MLVVVMLVLSVGVGCWCWVLFCLVLYHYIVLGFTQTVLWGIVCVATVFASWTFSFINTYSIPVFSFLPTSASFHVTNLLITLCSLKHPGLATERQCVMFVSLSLPSVHLNEWSSVARLCLQHLIHSTATWNLTIGWCSKQSPRAHTLVWEKLELHLVRGNSFKGISHKSVVHCFTQCGAGSMSFSKTLKQDTSLRDSVYPKINENKDKSVNLKPRWWFWGSRPLTLGFKDLLPGVLCPAEGDQV